MVVIDRQVDHQTNPLSILFFLQICGISKK